MANEAGLTIGFPRMYNEPGERRAFLPALVGRSRSLDVDVASSPGSGRHGLPRRRLPVRVAAGQRRGRGHGVPPVDRRRAARPRGPLRADPARAPSSSRCSTSPRGRSGSSCSRPGHRGDRAGHGHRRRRPAPGPEPARRGPQRPCLRLRRARAALAAAARRPRARRERHRPGRRRRREARDRVGGPLRRRGAQRALHARGPAGRRDRRRRAEPRRQRGLLPPPARADGHPRRRDGPPRHLAPAVPERMDRLPARHAVICDLAVDPYLLDDDPPVVRGIEGIPQGNLDQWEFDLDDPAWDRLPPGPDAASAGRSCRATRGRACGRSRAWSCTARRSPRCSRRWSGTAGCRRSRPACPSTGGRSGGQPAPLPWGRARRPGDPGSAVRERPDRPANGRHASRSTSRKSSTASPWGSRAIYHGGWKASFGTCPRSSGWSGRQGSRSSRSPVTQPLA